MAERKDATVQASAMRMMGGPPSDDDPRCEGCGRPYPEAILAKHMEGCEGVRRGKEGS